MWHAHCTLCVVSFVCRDCWVHRSYLRKKVFFTVMSLVTWSLNESEAGVNIVMIKDLPAFLLLMMLHAN